MIDLDKYYSHLGPYELIEIIESNSDYKPDVIAYCKLRIDELNLELDVIKTHASVVLRKRFSKYFTDGKYKIDKPIILNSEYLNRYEVKRCFDESKAEHIRDWNFMTDGLDI